MRDQTLIQKDFFNRYVAKLAKRRQDMDRILELLDEKENSIKQLRYFYFCVFTLPCTQRTSTVVFQVFTLHVNLQLNQSLRECLLLMQLWVRRPLSRFEWLLIIFFFRKCTFDGVFRSWLHGILWVLVKTVVFNKHRYLT